MVINIIFYIFAKYNQNMQILSEYCKKIGIYCIHNIVNNHRYIGSSKNIQQRLLKHRHNLRNNIHQNQYLQNAWNKYTEISFICYVLEYCDEENLSKLEEHYINLFGNYNIIKDIIRLKMTDETKRKHSETKKRMFKEKKLKSLSSVKVDQYDIFGEYVTTYENIRECMKNNNLRSTTIYNYFNKKHTVYSHILKGYVFIRRDNENDVVDFKNLIVHSIKDLVTNKIYIGNNYKQIQNYLEIKFQINSYKKPYKNRYIAALVKPCELLEHPEEDNQQPSFVVIH